MSARTPDTLLFKVRRYVPGRDDAPHWEDYRLAMSPGMTVLDGLWRIRETLDPTLAWRASCRMGICGSCGMMINGKPSLACNTQVADLGTRVVAVAPLPNFAIIRDLVPDLSSMFEMHRELKPWLIREDAEEQEKPSTEYWQSPRELERYLQFSYCIKCGCCMSACPTVATDPEYTGPMPLAQAHRYNNDSRDAGFDERQAVLSEGRGPWRCHFAGECSQACPKGVDPARAIQRMKRDLVLDLFHLRRKREAAVAKPAEKTERLPDIPAPPPRTV